MQKSCKNCQKSFQVLDQDREFYKKMEVPEPTQCPDCRHMRRHGMINDYVFYTRTCDQCQKPFVSMFPQKSEYKVYCANCWYSEERDHFADGRDYDFNKSFFQQFDELMHATPQLGIIGMNNENCDYCESVANSKNCLLISECSNCEDCFYGYWLQKSKDCYDSAYIHECERCYEILYCFNCYNLKYSQNCFTCSDSAFLDNCVGCKNCFFSTNLNHKEFYIFNKLYTKESYFEEIKKFDFSNLESVENLKQKFQEFLKTQARKNLQIENVEYCTGDYIRNAKNCRNVYHCYDAEECAYGEHVWRGAKYCMDSNTAGRNAELLYETTNSGINSYNVKFSRYCWGCHNTEYSNECKNGNNLFGCVCLKPGAKYCILNKEYSPEKYGNLVQKIKEKMLADGEYGEFFPLSISLFGFNNSVSFDEFPLTKAEVLAKDWKWEDQESGTRGHKGEGILECSKCARNFKLIPQELNFYKSMELPAPRKCPDCRHRERLSLKNKKKLHDTTCSECHKNIQTTLDTSQFSNILCDTCYKNLVY